MSTMSVSEARAHLPRILDLVIGGEEVTITRHGEPVAVLIRPDAVRARRSNDSLDQAEQLRALVDRARGIPLSDSPTITRERGEALVADVAASRRSR